jgi:hypothetical protein
MQTGCWVAGRCRPGLVGVVARSNMVSYLSSRARYFGFVVGIFLLPSLQYVHATPRVPVGTAEEVLLLGAVTELAGDFAGDNGFDTVGFLGGVFGVLGFLERITGAAGFFVIGTRLSEVFSIPKTPLHWPVAL